MKLKNGLISAVVTVACAASVLTAATANAAPAAQNIGYNANLVGNHIVLTTTAGSLRTANGELQILDSTGRVVTEFPLSYSINNVSHPIQASARGRSATLTPQIPGRIQVDQPLTRQERDQQALNQLGSNVSTAVAIGGLIGTLIGAAVGCVLLSFLPPIPILTGCVTGSAIGALAGTVIAGGPTLIGAVDQYFRTIRSPFTPPKTVPVPVAPAAPRR